MVWYPNSAFNILIVSCGAFRDEKDTTTTKGIARARPENQSCELQTGENNQQVCK